MMRWGMLRVATKIDRRRFNFRTFNVMARTYNVMARLVRATRCGTVLVWGRVTTMTCAEGVTGHDVWRKSRGHDVWGRVTGHDVWGGVTAMTSAERVTAHVVLSKSLGR
jgi:hypothetical protein